MSDGKEEAPATTADDRASTAAEESSAQAPAGGDPDIPAGGAPDAPRVAESEPPGGSDDKAVKDRWWVDFGPKDNRSAAPAVTAPAPVGEKFYRAAKGFEQEAARSRLTDSNLKLLIEANPAEGEWGYVLLSEEAFPEADAEQIRQSVDLPSYARGALIDSGRSVRLLITGTPIGERVLELALGKTPSFDCWIEDDWVREMVFKDRKRALRAIGELIRKYLSPEGIAAWEADRARY